MEKIEFKVSLSDWSEFERGDVLRVEDIKGVDGIEGGRFISIEKSGGNREKKYKITSKDQEINSTDTAESLLVKMVKYNVVRVGGSMSVTGTITFGSFLNYFCWFVIDMDELPVSGKSGSGGGLRR